MKRIFRLFAVFAMEQIYAMYFLIEFGGQSLHKLFIPVVVLNRTRKRHRDREMSGNTLLKIKSQEPL